MDQGRAPSGKFTAFDVRSLKRLRARGTGLALRARRGAWHLAHLYRGRFPGLKNRFGLPLESLRAPLTTIPLDSRIVHTFDFLADRITLTGEPMTRSPHTSFVREFLVNPSFDYRATEYYRRTVQGTLAVPSAGVPHAEWRSRNFIYVINSLAIEGYLPARHGAIVVVECADDRLMVINGKHRVATLLAMGQPECDVVIYPANEIRALVEGQVRQLWPGRYYARQFDALNSIGKPLAAQAARIEALKRRIRDARLEQWNDVYHPLPFHEFAELRPMIDATTAYRRLAMILREYDDWQGRTVLDLGCNLGFYSFSLAKRGARATGVDIRSEYLEIAAELSKIYGLPVCFRASPVTTEFINQLQAEYDLVLCFSMLQWIAEHHGQEYGEQVLAAVAAKSKALFFDVAVNSGRAQLRCKPGEEIAFVYRLLRRCTTYPDIRYVGDVEPWGEPRHVFYCSR